MRAAIGVALLVAYVVFLVFFGRRLGRETPSFKRDHENFKSLDRYTSRNVERALDLANRHVVHPTSAERGR